MRTQESKSYKLARELRQLTRKSTAVKFDPAELTEILDGLAKQAFDLLNNEDKATALNG